MRPYVDGVLYLFDDDLLSAELEAVEQVGHSLHEQGRSYWPVDHVVRHLMILHPRNGD